VLAVFFLAAFFFSMRIIPTKCRMSGHSRCLQRQPTKPATAQPRNGALPRRTTADNDDHLASWRTCPSPQSTSKAPLHWQHWYDSWPNGSSTGNTSDSPQWGAVKFRLPEDATEYGELVGEEVVEEGHY